MSMDLVNIKRCGTSSDAQTAFCISNNKFQQEPIGPIHRPGMKPRGRDIVLVSMMLVMAISFATNMPWRFSVW